jgi:hypothetical protein
VVREGVGAGGRNDPSLACTYEFKKKKSSLTKLHFIIITFFLIQKFRWKKIQKLDFPWSVLVAQEL